MDFGVIAQFARPTTTLKAQPRLSRRDEIEFGLQGEGCRGEGKNLIKIGRHLLGFPTQCVEESHLSVEVALELGQLVKALF